MSNVIYFPFEPPVPPVPGNGPAPDKASETNRGRGICKARALVVRFSLDPWDIFPELATDEVEALEGDS